MTDSSNWSSLGSIFKRYLANLLASSSSRTTKALATRIVSTEPSSTAPRIFVTLGLLQPTRGAGPPDTGESFSARLGSRDPHVPQGEANAVHPGLRRVLGLVLVTCNHAHHDQQIGDGHPRQDG